MERNYIKEHEMRKKRLKRLVCDIDIEQAETFTKYLNDKNISFRQWLINQIRVEIEKNI